MEESKTYICIDLKSFYASVECVERNLDPLTTNLVVADSSRSEKTICLAITPALKKYGLGGRARLFEVVQKVKEINRERKKSTNNFKFIKKSFNATELDNNPNLELDFIIAPPRMAHYIEVSSKIYSIYLKYIAPEDIHVYSIDEVFMDVTKYLKAYQMTPHDLAMKMIKDVLRQTGITATAGIGTNLYLAKVAMDIVAKKMPADQDGVRIASLDEKQYRKELWEHTPFTDFWRVGRGYANKLIANGMFTMGDVALKSIEDEDLLYSLFGINAELLIDHAWGYEPCTIEAIKKYKPDNKSLGSGQVLSEPYNFNKGKLIVKEMMDSLALDLCDKGYVTNQLVLTIGYDVNNIENNDSSYQGEISLDYLGRKIPKHAHGTITLPRYTSSSRFMMSEIVKLYEAIVDKKLYIRRVYITAINVITEGEARNRRKYRQLNLFDDLSTNEDINKEEELKEEKDLKSQKAILAIKKKYGKNAVMKGSNLEEGATMKERNEQIGGHKA